MLAPERMENPKKSRPPKSTEHLHKNLQRLRQRTLGLHGSAPDTLPRVEKRRGYMPPSLIQEASPTDNNQQMKIQCSLIQSHQGNKVLLKVGCMIIPLSFKFDHILNFKYVLQSFPPTGLPHMYFYFSFHGIPECANQWVSVCVCFMCLFLDSFPPCSFVLFQ